MTFSGSPRRRIPRSFLSSWSPAVRALLVLNGGVFLAQLLVGRPLTIFLGLVPELIHGQLFLWQPVTYLFLHGGLFHLLLNMLILWMFGNEVERVWGAREFLKYYFICGVGAALLTVATSWHSRVPTVGASGALYGVLVAFALLFPNRLIYLYFLIPLRAKYVVLLFAALEFLASYQHVNDGIGHTAHLGGMIVGYLYIRQDWRLTSVRGRIRRWRQRRRMRLLVSREREEQRLREEVDRLLDKIAREGMVSLTPSERHRLEQASRLLRSRNVDRSD